jgi:hypothetical protein
MALPAARHSGATAICLLLAALMVLLSMTGHWEGQAFLEGEMLFPLAQMVGFGLGSSKMLYFSMGID